MGFLERREDLRILHFSGHFSESTLDRRFEGYASLQFIERGRIDVHYDDACYELEGPALWFHYPGPHIRFNREGNRRWFHRYVAFQGPLWEAWQAAGLIRPEPLQCQPATGAWFSEHFDEMLQLFRRAHPYARIAGIDTLEAVLLKAYFLAQASLGESGTLARLREVLQETNYATPDYAALAASLGVSAPTLRRRFRSENGISIHAYVQRERVEKARRLVLETDLSLAAIASSLAYSDIHYFTSHFKKWTGVTPAQLRRSRL